MSFDLRISRLRRTARRLVCMGLGALMSIGLVAGASEITQPPTPSKAQPSQTPAQQPAPMPRSRQSPAPGSPKPVEPAPQRTIPDPTPDDANRVVQPQDFNSNNLNNSIGLAAGPQSNSPAMIGDFFGSTGSSSTVIVLTSFTAPGLTIIDSRFNTGAINVGPGNLGIANTNVFPVPFFLSSPGAPPDPKVGDVIGLGDPQLNILPDLTLPNPPGSSPFRIVNGTATATVVPFPGSPVNGRLGIADVFYQTQTAVSVNIPNPGGGGSVGGQKIAEGNSPMPRDRVFAFYDFFENVPLAPGGVNVNRLSPGFEKTFFNQLMSFEVRLPMALTLDSNIVPGMTQMSHGEVGNLTLAYKGLLYADNTWAFSGGTGITAPTADDVNVFDSLGNKLVTIQNQATHIMPFVGALWTPNDRWFSQSFVQVDVDAAGNPVAANLTGAGLVSIGRLQSPTFLYASQSVGRWLVRNRAGLLTGLSLMGELHYNRSLQTPDTIAMGSFAIGDFSTNIELFNLTLGTTWQFRNRGYLTTAYCTPLGGGADQQFDGQFRLMYNRRFGPNLSRPTF